MTEKSKLDRRSPRLRRLQVAEARKEQAQRSAVFRVARALIRSGLVRILFWIEPKEQ